MTEPSPNRDLREQIRAELKETRTAYHELLNSLSPEDWKKKTGNPSWNVGQLMWHIAFGDGFVPGGVDSCKKGKGFNPPQVIAGQVNKLMTWWGARNATPRSVAEKYDQVHAENLTKLEEVADDDWGKGAKVFGQLETVESTMRSPVAHFKEHQADILKELGRA